MMRTILTVLVLCAVLSVAGSLKSDEAYPQRVLNDFFATAGSGNATAILAQFDAEATVEVPWGAAVMVSHATPNCSEAPPALTATQFAQLLIMKDNAFPGPGSYVTFTPGFTNVGGVSHVAAIVNVSWFNASNGVSGSEPHIFMARVNVLSRKITHMRVFVNSTFSSPGSPAPVTGAELHDSIVTNYAGFCQGNVSATMALFSKEVQAAIYLHGAPFFSKKNGAKAVFAKTLALMEPEDVLALRKEINALQDEGTSSSFCGYKCVEAMVKAQALYVNLEGQCHVQVQHMTLETCGLRVGTLVHIAMPKGAYIHEFNAFRLVSRQGGDAPLLPLITEYDMWSRLYTK